MKNKSFFKSLLKNFNNIFNKKEKGDEELSVEESKVRLKLYEKFISGMLKDGALEEIIVFDTETLKEYHLSVIDSELYMESINDTDEEITYELFERLVIDYLISRLLDIEHKAYAIDDDTNMYILALTGNNSLTMEQYSRKVFVEIAHNPIDK